MLGARFDLGKGYLEGTKGIEKNYNKAKVVFEKLAEDNYVGGFYYLAECYHFGYGVAKDDKKAVELYERAANNGHTLAAEYLSKVYLTGIKDVTPEDRSKFVKYYNQVCGNGAGIGGKQLRCTILQGDIMEACMKIHKDNTDFLNPNSDIDPECRQVTVKVLAY